MTYFIATKQIIEYEAESQRLKSKTETTKYLLFFGNRNRTQLENETPSTPVRGPAINYNGSVNLKRDHPLWEFALPLGTLTHGGTFVIKRLSRGGESIEEFYIFSALH